jgi:hypothetical protein
MYARWFVLGPVGFANEAMKTLNVKVYAADDTTIENTMRSAIVLIKESQSAAMAEFALGVSNSEHVIEVQDVRIDMNAVDFVGLVDGDVLEGEVALVVNNFHVLDVGNLLVDVI